LTNKQLSLSPGDIDKLLSSGDWYNFDDTHFLNLIRTLYNDEDPIIRLKAAAVLERKHPRLLAEMEYLRPRDRAEKDLFDDMVEVVEDLIDLLAQRYEIPRSLWYLWQQSGIVLTKVGSVTRVTEYEEDQLDQDVVVMDPREQTSATLVDIPHSLMSILSNNALYMLRVYVLLPPEKEYLREELSEVVRSTRLRSMWK
jgi:hypothetical protein